MIELTYQDIMPDRFLEAFGLLLEKDLDMGPAVEVARSIDTISKELANAKKVKNELIKKFGAEIKEDDKVVQWDISTATEENKLAFEEKYKDLLEQKFEIDMSAKVMLAKGDGKMKASHAYLLRKVIDIKS